jgi:ketosteroid isomerase-like protein
MADPSLDAADGPDPEHEALIADSVGLALLVVLDTLSPPERLSFVLHDLFGLPFEDIAPIVERSVPATRQLASRARGRVRGAAPRQEPGGSPSSTCWPAACACASLPSPAAGACASSPSPACQHRRVSESNVELARRGWEAAQRGDLDVIGELLDPDVKWHGGDPESGCQNRVQTLEFMRRAAKRRALPELVDVVGAGDKVAVIMARPSEQGGKELVANLTTFRDGKVVEMVHYPDANDALAAVGA